MRTQTIQKELKPLREKTEQVYLGIGIHTLGLLAWILEQTGPADVIVTTYSTSEEFLAGFLNLRKKGLIDHATMVADLKASKKTVKLNALMGQCFDNVFLGSNHSKIVLVNAKNAVVSVVSSQNNTYGGRAECTIITTDRSIFNDLYRQFGILVYNSVSLYGVHKTTTGEDTGTCGSSYSCFGDFRPFGAAE